MMKVSPRSQLASHAGSCCIAAMCPRMTVRRCRQVLMHIKTRAGDLKDISKMKPEKHGFTNSGASPATALASGPPAVQQGK